MIETLKEALLSGHTVAFTYGDKQRVVEVHAVGHSTKDGSLVMRGFQVAGERNGWALFTLDKMEALTPALMPLSEAPRPGFAAGDKQMSQVLFEVETENV